MSTKPDPLMVPWKAWRAGTILAIVVMALLPIGWPILDQLYYGAVVATAGAVVVMVMQVIYRGRKK